MKVASFPLHDDHLFRVSIEKQEQSHEKIIQSILKIINDLTSKIALELSMAQCFIMMS